ncbi:MAG: substrate-binding domain-containing protein [Ferruginibacter sp.]
MKKLFFVSMLLLSGYMSIAQQVVVVKVTGTRFTYDIFHQWIEQYERVKPGVKIYLDSKIPADSADIVIAAHVIRESDLKAGQTYISLNRYVQLPIVNFQRRDLEVLQAKGFTSNDFTKIFFSENSNTNDELKFDVFKRAKNACASQAFANHFGKEQKDINGVGVTGDDKDLLNVVKRNKEALSYNNLGFVYNIQTRKVTDSISVIPIDLNENGKVDKEENFYASLDDVINYSENGDNNKLPVEFVNVIFSKTASAELKSFLSWIIMPGQQYNHAYGFLNLPGKEILSARQTLAVSAPAHTCSTSLKKLLSK